MTAVGLPQKGCVVCLKPFESDEYSLAESSLPQAGSQVGEWARGNCVRAGPARGDFLEETASFNPGLCSEGTRCV